MSSPHADLKNRALRLLAGREYSRTELQHRLAQFEPSPGVLTLVLDELQTKGFVSDKRVLESVLHRRAPKLGGARIRQELQARGLDADAVTQALSDLRATELERAVQVWRKKFAGLHREGSMSPSLAAAERSKQIRFLASRGFAAETIRRVLGVADEEA